MFSDCTLVTPIPELDMAYNVLVDASIAFQHQKEPHPDESEVKGQTSQQQPNISYLNVQNFSSKSLGMLIIALSNCVVHCAAKSLAFISDLAIVIPELREPPDLSADYGDPECPKDREPPDKQLLIEVVIVLCSCNDFTIHLDLSMLVWVVHSRSKGSLTRQNRFGTIQPIVFDLLTSLVYSFVNYQAQLNQESNECGGSVCLLHIILKIKCYMLVRTYIDQVSARSDEILALSMLMSDNCLPYTRSQVHGIESKHESPSSCSFPSASEHIFYSEPHRRKIPEIKFRVKKILEVLQALE